MFSQYPYLNLNDFNLDYILKAIKDMRYEVTNFVSINAIKYADPIQWNITSQYEKNTIVIDPVTGTAYISVAPVPVGVALTRPEYWTVVFDLQSFVTKANQNLANNYEEQTTTTATMNTAEGDWIIWGDVLYKALVNITAGDAYVVGSNIQRLVIEDVINAIKQEIADEVQAINTTIGDLNDLTTTDKSSIVNAINDEVQARQNADTTLQGNIDAEALARQNADTTLQGNIDAEALARQNADTTLQGNIDAEAQARQDADTAMIQTINDAITQHIAPLEEEIASMSYDLSGHNIFFLLDSYGNRVTSDNKTIWAKFGELTGANCVGVAWGGAGAVNGGYINAINSYTGDKSVFDSFYLIGGANDQIADIGLIDNAMQNVINKIRTDFVNVKKIVVMACGITYSNRDSNNNPVPTSSRTYWKKYRDACSKKGCIYVDNAQYLLRYTTMLDTDYCHPSVYGVDEIVLQAVQGYLTGSIDVSYSLTPSLTPTESAWGSQRGWCTRRHNNEVSIVTQGAFGLLCANENGGTLTYLSKTSIGTLSNSLIDADASDGGAHLRTAIGSITVGGVKTPIVASIGVDRGEVIAYIAPIPYATGTVTYTSLEITSVGMIFVEE